MVRTTWNSWHPATASFALYIPIESTKSFYSKCLEKLEFCLINLGMLTSDETVNALYLSSFPSNISSTSEAFNNVMFDANECCPNPTKKK